MLKKVIVVLILCMQVSIVAQNYKFGKVSKEELQEDFYPLDSKADAAYLYKQRRSYFSYVSSRRDFELITEVHQRIKIYTKEGFDYATRYINLYQPELGDDERVGGIKGYTFYLENNKVIKEKLGKDGIFKNSLDDDNGQVKITMPKIKEGCVLEIKYTIYSPYPQYISDVVFQSGIPIKELKSQIEVPEYYIYKTIPKGYFSVPLIKTSKPGSIGELRFRMDVYKYEGSNMPALKDDEPYVGSIRSYRGGVKYELTQTDFLSLAGSLTNFSTSWQSVSKSIYRSSAFGEELNKKSFYKNDLETLLANATSDYEKIAIVFQFVKTKVKWNGIYGKYTDNGVRKAYLENVGNVADINLLLTSMLRFAGLDANPVLVSTRDNGIPYSPTRKGFNYVISAVTFADGTYVLLDGTEVYSIPNILPKRALNWKGRLIRKDGTSSWVNLTSPNHAIEDNSIMVKITEDLTIEGLIRTKFSNLNALEYRNKNNHLKEEGLITKLEEKYNIEIEDYKVLNNNDLGKQIIRTLKFSSEDLIEQINNKIYIEPLLFLTMRRNPFKLEERKFPVDFGSKWKDSYKIFIEIPKGFKVEKLPGSLAIGLPDKLGVFKYKVVQMGNKIQVNCTFLLNKGIIVPFYYADLKGFYGEVIKKETEKIILVKG